MTCVVWPRYLNGEPGLHAYDTAPVIAAFNIVLLKHALSNGGINVGRNRYFFPQGPTDQPLRLDSLLVAYRGLPIFSSIT
jgi:eukaryotic translation initiation factor 2C